MASVMDSVKSPSEKTPADLEETYHEIEGKVPEEYRDNYDRLILAGNEALWGDRTHDVLVNAYIKRNIKTEKDIPQAVAKGIAQLMGLIIRKSGLGPNELAAPAMVASQVLMIHVLIYLQKKKKFAISNRILAETSHATTKAMMKLFGITKDKFKAVLKAMHEQAKAQKNQEEEMPEGEEDMPFEEGQELPPDEMMEGEMPPEGMPPEGTVPPDMAGQPVMEMPAEELPPEELPPEELPPEELPPEELPPEEVPV